ncbi:PGF-pre-PGF domain-containing protein [uncultured Methanomethylovorans sp.]|uniref:PGF-pre-PGF domain-containing protein n=1 Tax=uncultured Methanomethylovorans sp. TaxID=183759 RepID=UPI00260FD8C2|nr:PGF-pre-PGF domain-containing protein [uncultured Methanomethylovorans sp.]
MKIKSIWLSSVVMMLLFVTVTASVGLADTPDMVLVGQFSGDASDVGVAGDHAYLGQGQDFVILDVSDVADPSEVGRITALSEVYDIAISGDHAYIANGDNGLVIVDVSTPSSPSLAGTYDTEGFALDIAISGNYAYVADGSGLVIVDVSTPSSPILAGTYDTTGYANGVAVSGNYAYVAGDSKGIFDGSNGIAVVDVSDPSSPRQVGSYGSIYAYDVAISNNHVYVADHTGLVILDVSDPLSPRSEGSYSAGGDTNDVAVSGNNAYVADHTGIFVLDVSTPSSPDLVSSYSTDGNVNGIEASGNYIYVADSSRGLVVLQQGASGGSIVTEDNSTSDTAIGSNLPGEPQLSLIGDRSVQENEMLTFTISATTVDGGSIVYTAAGLPAEATLDPTTGIFSWAPGMGTAGTYTVTFTAESNGLTDSETIILNVIASAQDQTLSMAVTDLQETGLSSSWIRWEWTNPDNPDFSHVMLYIDDVPVANTSESYYTATGLAPGISHSLTICSVDSSGNIVTEGVHDLATTLALQDISSISGINITPISITLAWEASDDTTGVQILRNGIPLGNVSGSTSYPDTGLNGDTIYNYTIIPYKDNGMEGKKVMISLRTPPYGTDNTKSIFYSSEDAANLIFTEALTVPLIMNTNVTYEFTGEGNDIMSVDFYSLQDSGDVTCTIEVLNGRSKLVSNDPVGFVYKYMNIWVGSSGFATGSDLKDARIKFKVNDSWLQDIGLTAADVRLQRYDGTVWEVLPTTVVNNDNVGHTVFESQTPGFSPFAITAKKELASSINADRDKAQGLAQRSNMFLIAMLIFLAGAFAAAYFYLRKGDS